MPTMLPERSAESREHMAVGAAIARLERFAEIAHRRKLPHARILAARREWWRVARRIRFLDCSEQIVAR